MFNHFGSFYFDEYEKLIIGFTFNVFYSYVSDICGIITFSIVSNYKN